MDQTSPLEKPLEQKDGPHLYLYGSMACAVVPVYPFSAVIQEPWSKSCSLFIRAACLGPVVRSFCTSYSEQFTYQTICVWSLYFVSFRQLAHADSGSIHFPDLRPILRGTC